MVFNKTLHHAFFNKGMGHKLIGGIKGAIQSTADVLDNDAVLAGIIAVAPEIGVPLTSGVKVAKATGLLERAKNL
jgi:hypothetical protein